MNKLCLFLLLSLIADAYLEDCMSISNPKSKSDCNGKLSDNDKNSNYAYCCYVSYSKKSEENGCVGIDKKYYDNIAKHMKISKKQEEIAKLRNEIDPDNYKYEDWGKMKMECNSNYLQRGILMLLLFLI